MEFGDDSLFDVFNDTESALTITSVLTKPQKAEQKDPTPVVSQVATGNGSKASVKAASGAVELSVKRERADASDSTSAATSTRVKLDTQAQGESKKTPLNTLTTHDAKKISATRAEIDMFATYQEQVVVGNAKPDKSDGNAKNCAMQVCYPPGWDFENKQLNDFSLPQRPPAKTYKFTLDPFQQRAIESIERNQSVLVSAHTSAGKTVVAEYAIALSLKQKQRVIYTSPIKALSNQKFRELQEEFTDVGLMTGDITINPSASCLVMTTEILRNMLYRGSEVVREVAWVIFDEIHYMRDRSRGVVWEETIILLPRQCHFVFLSATIPNAAEFALWVAKLHNQPCNVVYTDYRPTPLQHFVYPSGGDGLYLVLDQKGVFREQNFQRALSQLNKSGGEDIATRPGKPGTQPEDEKKIRTKGAGEDVLKLVKIINDQNLLPCVVFSFSKRECEKYAVELSKMDFCLPDEKDLIAKIYSNALDSLSADDRGLPQVASLRPLIMKGIGIHHGGLLPLLKEVIEILFQEGLIKVLFATETFAMGLNMPARTVLFTSVQKFDGVDSRPLTSGEYIQMSGRAGRRGLDDKGVVMMLLSGAIDPNVCKEMITGAADPLKSSFHLGYNMLLNLLRVEEADPEFMMARSFYQFQQQRATPLIKKELDEVQAEYTSLIVPREREAVQYYALRTELEQLRLKLRQFITQPEVILPYLKEGRIVRLRSANRAALQRHQAEQKAKLVAEAKQHATTMITFESDADKAQDEKGGEFYTNPEDDEYDWGYGVVISYTKRTLPTGTLTAAHAPLPYVPPGRNVVPPSMFIVDVLLACDPDSVVVPDEKPMDKTRNPNAKKMTEQKRLEQVHKQATYLKPCPPGKEPTYVIVPMTTSTITNLSTVCLKVPNNVRDFKNQHQLGLILQEASRRLKGNFPMFDPLQNMQIKDDAFKRNHSRAKEAQEALEAHPLHKDPERDDIMSQYVRKLSLKAQIERLQQRLRNLSQDAGLIQTLQNMKRVLRALGHTTAEDIIDTKGRVACELSTCDELVGTELMFSGAFQGLSPEHVCALCSCLIYDEPPEEGFKVPAEFEESYQKLREIAQRVGDTIVECKLPLDVKKFVDGFNPQLMEVVLNWCKGAKFAEICQMTDVFEGSIIRMMRRLEELLRQYVTAAKVVGNEPLAELFTQCISKLKRDIVFAASLYL